MNSISVRIVSVACTCVGGLACGGDGAPKADSEGASSGLTGLSGISAGETDPASATMSEPEDDDEDKLDIGLPSGDIPQGCAGDGNGGGSDDDGEVDFSYIWVANSVEGTMSKINTVTMVEEGRYIVRPDGVGNPSRTSVNLSGDVAVANRAGGVTKVFAVAEDCPDLDGDGSITTSTSNIPLPWGTDECVAWHTPFQYESQRPVAWAPGEWSQTECDFVDQKLWSAGGNSATGVEVLLLDGETGVLEQTVAVPEFVFDGYGIYGAAVDGEGNFWGSQLSGGTLVRVDRQSFEYRTWPIPISGYGMTVDSEGYVWVCSNDVARFDPETETWQQATVGGSGGCMADGEGTLWMASNQLVGVDTQTLQVVNQIPVPSYVHGVSIDAAGFVWGVTLQEPYAYRADPITGLVQTFEGLNGPYTYSDMTGFALKNAGTIPTPQG